MNLKLASLLFAALLLSGPLYAEPVQAPHVRAELIAEHTSLVPGSAPNWLALRLTPEAGWHVYWQNPGDSGLATKIEWTLPDGISAGDIQWPLPHTQKLGDLTNYGYDQDTLHLVPLHVPAGIPIYSAEISAQAKWLVCLDVCIPGSAQLALTLPVLTETEPDTRWTALFTQARAQLPIAMPEWIAHFNADKTDFSLQISGSKIPADASLSFYPLANDLVNHNAVQRIAMYGGTLRLSQTLSNYFIVAPAVVKGVLVAGEGPAATAYQIEAQPGPVTPVPEAAVATPVTLQDQNLWVALLFALLGGLILNLMPCVFPVLSLKAISLVQSMGQAAAQQRRHALAYTAGVMLSCTAIALLLLSLRAGGAAIGWGFQLQSPVFVAALAYLMFALGLSLSGVFEFGTRWMGLGQALTERRGLSGSFFTGVLATVVATPCTAPFMGTALGYAITQPLLIALLVFMILGLGLALPFLLLGFFPRLAAFLPRPGAWMETFKQVMAFPLYLTAVWLVWVLARQTGVNGAGIVLTGLVLIAFALWLWPRHGLLPKFFQISALVAAGLLLASPWLKPLDHSTITSSAEGEVYSAERLEELRADQRSVFVNFTADWCITCKVNERVTLASSRVHEAFAQKQVAWLTADWTRADPAITRVLEQFGRNGVPLYLIYTPGAEPKVLPQVLTPDIVIDALNN